MRLFRIPKPSRKELETLIALQKKELHRMHKAAPEFIEEVSAKTVKSIINRNKHLIQEPYLFVTRKGEIITFTPSLAKILEIDESAEGKNYFEIFGTPKDSEEVRRLVKNYFSSPEEKKVSHTITVSGKERKIIITKERPVYIHDIDLTILNRTQRRDLTSYIPIKIEAPGFWSRDRNPDLLEIIGADMKTIYHKLATTYRCKDVSKFTDKEAIKLYRKKEAEAEKTQSQEQ